MDNNNDNNSVGNTKEGLNNDGISSGILKEKFLQRNKISEIIGKEDDARNSFVYLTLIWSFRAGIVITALIFINAWLFRQNEKVPDAIGEVTTAWEIIIPLVTLALGYAFGKSKN